VRGLILIHTHPHTPPPDIIVYKTTKAYKVASKLASSRAAGQQGSRAAGQQGSRAKAY